MKQYLNFLPDDYKLKVNKGEIYNLKAIASLKKNYEITKLIDDIIFKASLENIINERNFTVIIVKDLKTLLNYGTVNFKPLSSEQEFVNYLKTTLETYLLDKTSSTWLNFVNDNSTTLNDILAHFSENADADLKKASLLLYKLNLQKIYMQKVAAAKNEYNTNLREVEMYLGK